VSLVTSLVVAAIGLCAMVGWIVGIEAMKRIGPGPGTMKFNTAFCLALLGVGIAARAHTRIARAASAIVLTVAAISLVEYLTGWTVGIDELVFQDHASDTSHPGRLALIAGVCLSLGAIALIALRSGHRHVVSGTAFCILTVGWLGFVGYVYGARAFYDAGQFSPIAVNTTAALALLGVALLASTPNGPLPWIVRGDDPGAKVLRRILPLVIVGMPIIVDLRLLGQKAGWFETEAGLSLMVVVTSTGVAGVTLHMAHAINRSHQSSVERGEQLYELNRSLEARIDERTAELVTREAWARALAGTAPVGIFNTDADGVLTYVNSRWCEIFGVSSDDAIGTTAEGSLHPDDRTAVVAEWSRSLAEETGFDNEFRIVRPTGAISRIRAHVVRVVDGRDSGAGYVGTVDDVTARREAEQALRETEELFRFTFGSSPVAMALVDADGRIVEANRALCELTGHGVEVLLTMRLQSILHPDNVGDGARGGVASVDQRFIRADGSVGWASVRYARIGGPDDGDPGLTIVQFVDTTERREFEDQLAHLANHDSLTGIFNRRSLDAALENHIAHCRRYGPVGAVLIIDLDHFKRINDTYGHNVGDQVIVTTAHLLRQGLRESDLVARLGGDEFVVLLPAGDAAAARVVAQSLVDAIRVSSTGIGGGQIALSASIGIAVFDNVDRSPDEMLVNADLAMYDAKELGRDGWAEFAAEKYDVPRSKSRLTWIDRIEAALDNDSFVLHAQPIIDLATGEQVQLELLIRMVSEQGDLIPPGTFLNIAERYGLSTRIDTWVLNQALDLLEATGGDPRPVVLAVNINGTSLGDDQLLDFLTRRIRAGRFAPERLVLEVAETAAVNNLGEARVFAERLREAGCRFSLGEFGAGFGSFYCLRHLPFDFIKIDGGLVAECLDDSTDRAIIGSLVDLARNVGKKTIASHVPSDRVRNFLRDRGVDHGQGFHLGPPVPLGKAIPGSTADRSGWLIRAAAE
jgi:diguanylate cyclase (GGDEF)-like protein/PAS domain S-box-containing protein